MKTVKSVWLGSFCLLSTLSPLLSASAFDWPAAGGTATIPAGELVEVTSGADLAAAAACGEIVVSSGATLSFTNITANATFNGKISGAGSFLATNAKTGNKASVSTGCYRLTFTGDLSGFSGDWRFRYVYATFNTAKSGTFPMTYVEENTTTVQFQGANTYANPIDFNGGPNQGLSISGAATLTGDITWRNGSIRGASGNPPAAGGTITGSISCPNNSIYIQNGIKMLGAEIRRSSSGGSVLVDGGPLNLKAKIVNFATLNTYRTTGLITFLAENLIPDGCEINFGCSYADDGRLDLNGFSQRCKGLRDATSNGKKLNATGTTINSSSGPATLTILNQPTDREFGGTLVGHVSLCVDSSSAYTLSLTGGVHTTDGAVRVKQGKLRLGPGAGFSKLSELEVNGTGQLTVQNSNINPGVVDLKLADSGALTLAEGVTLCVAHATLNGEYLSPGSYTKDSPAVSGNLLGEGTLLIVNAAPIVAGDTFVWTGEGSDDRFTTAANWQGGVAPQFDGTEKLVLGGGTHSATVDCEAKVYGITVADDAPFALNAAENAKVVMGTGGFCFTNTAASGTIMHSLLVPVELGELPQHWTVAANVSMETSKPWTGRASSLDAALVIHAFGRIHFWADNSGLETVLQLTNCTTTASQPYLHNQKALGSPNRQTYIHGCLPRFRTSERPMTNNVPLFIDNRAQNDPRGYFNDNSANILCLDAPITYKNSGSNAFSESYFYGGVYFRGPITVPVSQLLTFRMPGGVGWLEGEGINSKGEFAIDYSGTFNIASTNNDWSMLSPYKCTVKMHAANALPAGKPVAMSNSGVYVGNVYLDLNGYDQSISRLFSRLPVANHATHAATVTSAEPATLTIQTSGVNNDVGPFRFTGKASLIYDAPGIWSMTNWISHTEGSLLVKQGMVKICSGAGWTATTNVVLRGGTIAVAPNAGEKAFGAAQDQSTAWLTYESGSLDIAAGERATVQTVVYTENGKEKSLVPGIYWASDTTESVAAKYKLDWITGKGSLRVMKSAIPLGTFLIIR